MSEKSPPPAPPQIPRQPGDAQYLQDQDQQPPQYGSQPQPPSQVAQGVYPPQPQPAQQPYASAVVQQPLPVTGMTIPVAGGNRNVNNLPRNAQGKREWSFGLCECFADRRTFMFAWCCPCMMYAQIKQRLDYLNMHARPDPTQGGSGVDANCMNWCLTYAFTGCGFVLPAINRGRMRTRYVIDGNGCGDLCVACCCHPCQLTQEHRELNLEEQALGQ